jgi:hypothetical protein|nr:MAG TPA: hypothetical protein [Caudoviricetes sp.]
MRINGVLTGSGQSILAFYAITPDDGEFPRPLRMVWARHAFFWSFLS